MLLSPSVQLKQERVAVLVDKGLGQEAPEHREMVSVDDRESWEDGKGEVSEADAAETEWEAAGKQLEELRLSGEGLSGSMIDETTSHLDLCLPARSQEPDVISDQDKQVCSGLDRFRCQVCPDVAQLVSEDGPQHVEVDRDAYGRKRAADPT